MQDMATYSRSSSRLLESQETASAACPLTATRDGRENARKEGSPARSRPLADWGRHGSSPARLLARAMKTKRGGSYQDRGRCGTSPARARATQPQKRADVPRADAMSQAGGQVRRPPGKARTRTRKPKPRATSTPGGWKRERARKRRNDSLCSSQAAASSFARWLGGGGSSPPARFGMWAWVVVHRVLGMSVRMTRRLDS